jgi:hypothetical protein
MGREKRLKFYKTVEMNRCSNFMPLRLIWKASEYLWRLILQCLLYTGHDRKIQQEKFGNRAIFALYLMLYEKGKQFYFPHRLPLMLRPKSQMNRQASDGGSTGKLLGGIIKTPGRCTSFFSVNFCAFSSCCQI